MISKKINRLKSATVIVLAIIVLCIIGYRSLRDDKPFPERDGVKSLPETNKTIIKGTPINTPIDVSLRDSIVSFGTELLGTPYVSASCSRDGFDCSGFVYFVFLNFKITVPRSSVEFKNFGKEIPIDSVKKGDILVFLSPTRNEIGHIGIVTNPKGMESDFIHATSSSEMKVIISSLKQEGYARRFVKAVDVLNLSQ